VPRANRTFVPNHIWHITHRCHNKDFLLDEPVTRKLWLSNLRKAIKRYKTIVLGYNVTCNHIHLLAQDPGIKDAIPRTMQYVQGRTAQKYNTTSQRINAFWGDRYSGTAVESGRHLLNCITYINLNMVRTGRVQRPEQWEHSSYYELMNPFHRNSVVNANKLAMLLGCKDTDELRNLLKKEVDETIKVDNNKRDSKWSESMAIGSHKFIETFRRSHKKTIHPNRVEHVDDDIDSCVLKEVSIVKYGNEPEILTGDNTVAYDESIEYLSD